MLIEIPYWLVYGCSGFVLCLVVVGVLGWWASRSKKKQVLDELSGLAVEFVNEGESDER